MVDNNSNPKVTITNTSGIKVEIFDVYNPSEDPKGKLTYTKLGTIEAGQTQDIQTIRSASQLQAMYTGTVPALSNDYYHQFPVAVFGVSALDALGDDDDQPPKPISEEISENSKIGMEQAFNFVKYSTANPDSKIAQDFLVASSDDKGARDAVDKFFAQSPNFSKCTLPAWTAIMSWQNQFTSAWQGPYHLYTQEENGSVKKVAVVNIDSNADENTAILAMVNDKGEITDKSQKITLSMVGDGYISESEKDMGKASVRLFPVWMNISVTDNKGNIQSLIGSALSGTVGSAKVNGTQQSMEKEPSFWETVKTIADKVVHPPILDSLIEAIMKYGMLYVTIKQVQEYMKQGKNKAENEVAERPGARLDNLRNARSSIRQAQEQIELGAELQIRSEVQKLDLQSRGVIADLRNELASGAKRKAMRASIKEQAAELKKALQIEPASAKFQEIADSLVTASQHVKMGDFQSAEIELKNLKGKLDVAAKEGSAGIKAHERLAADNMKNIEEARLKEVQAIDDFQREKAREVERKVSEPIVEEHFRSAPREFPRLSRI